MANVLYASGRQTWAVLNGLGGFLLGALLSAALLTRLNGPGIVLGSGLAAAANTIVLACLFHATVRDTASKCTEVPVL